MFIAQSQHETSTAPFTASIHQAGVMPVTQDTGHRAAAAGPSYPSLWRTWNSRRVVSLTGQDDERQAPGPTKELIRGSPVPIRARDDAASSTLDTPPPPGSVRRFTMDQFQREFGPCHTYSAPASPLRKRFSVDSTETIPIISPHPRSLVQPTFAAAAAAAVPATLGTGGWRPVTGRFSLDSPSLPRRWNDQRFGDTSTLPLARKPVSAPHSVPADRTRAVQFSEAFDESG